MRETTPESQLDSNTRALIDEDPELVVRALVTGGRFPGNFEFGKMADGSNLLVMDHVRKARLDAHNAFVGELADTLEAKGLGGSVHFANVTNEFATDEDREKLASAPQLLGLASCDGAYVQLVPCFENPQETPKPNTFQVRPRTQAAAS